MCLTTRLHAAASLLTALLIGSIPTAASTDPLALCDTAPFLDTPRGLLRPASSRAWLLDRDSAAPPASWPLPRIEWLGMPTTPALDWHRLAQGPHASARQPWLSWSDKNLTLHASPRLETVSWSISGDETGSLREDANGLDLEACWSGRVAGWLHMRDAGVDGDLSLLGNPILEERQSWRWTTVEAGGDLTHDEQRAGTSLLLPMGSSRARISLVKDHLRWGSGLLRTTGIQGDRSPAWSQFLLQFESGPLRYSQSVGELFSGEPDSALARRDASGLSKIPFREKWLLAHRLEFLGRWGGLALGEALVLGDRRPGPGALIPTGFLWSEQHAQGDRDNVLLFLDGRLRLPGLVPGAWQVHGELCVDDYTLADLGGDEEGQRTASLIGITGCPLTVTGDSDRPSVMNLGGWLIPGISWFTLEHTRVRPYVGTHFYSANRYDHGGLSLGATPEPNSRVTDWEWRHEVIGPAPVLGSMAAHSLLVFSVAGSHLVHGRNPTGTNVGGDRLLPHRDGLDAPTAPFLAGAQEIHDLWRAGLQTRWSLSWKQRPLGALSLDLAWSSLRHEQAGDSRSSRMREFALRWVSPF